MAKLDDQILHSHEDYMLVPLISNIQNEFELFLELALDRYLRQIQILLILRLLLDLHKLSLPTNSTSSR
jgi:hypothetical protein